MAKRKKTPRRKSKISSNTAFFYEYLKEQAGLSEKNQPKPSGKRKKKKKRLPPQTFNFEGKKYGGKLNTVLRALAKKSKLPLKKYLEKHADEIRNLIKYGRTHLIKKIDTIINIIDRSEIDKFGIVRQSGKVRKYVKAGIIQKLLEFQQHVITNSTVVMLATTIYTYLTGEIDVFIPEGYDEFEDDEEITDFLDEFDDKIDYIKSDPNK